MTPPEEIHITSELDVLKARIMGKKMAAALGFGEISLAEIEIVISELGTNIVKHAGASGKLVFQPIADKGSEGIEIIASDHGRGIQDIEHAMGGGSTAGTLGIGLSGIRRLMDEMDCQANAGGGVIIRSRKWRTKDFQSKVHCSVLAKPKLGENVSGDMFFFKQLPSLAVFSVIDALGHGFHAHQVAGQALQILENNYQESLLTIIQRCHTGLAGTRGAAMALGRIDFRTGKLQHISIGNVETRIYSTPDLLRPVCTNGTLGMTIGNARVNEYPYTKGACIVMFSDGISGKFEIGPEILRKIPQEISRFVFMNHAKDHDDATVLVLK